MLSFTGASPASPVPVPTHTPRGLKRPPRGGLTIVSLPRGLLFSIEAIAVADDQLGFVPGEQVRQRDRNVGLGRVEEAEHAGVLGDRAADHAPRGERGQVGVVDRAAGDEHEP